MSRLRLEYVKTIQNGACRVLIDARDLVLRQACALSKRIAVLFAPQINARKLPIAAVVTIHGGTFLFYNPRFKGKHLFNALVLR